MCTEIRQEHCELADTFSCNACHKKKIRCSATGPPCTKCESLGIECVYPLKDRKVKVGEQYLRSLVEENQRLSSNVTSVDGSAVLGHALPVNIASASSRLDHISRLTTPSRTSTSAADDDADRNPIIEEQPWFVSINTNELPIHVGEAADAAFATRLRQTVGGTSVPHLPRVHYMSDEALQALQDPQWPSASRLRFLVDVALRTICPRWHIVRRSVVLVKTQNLIRQPESCDWLTRCSIWALLAIGEVSSSRCAISTRDFPGAKYWIKAMSLISLPPERPRLEVIEIYLLLVGRESDAGA